LIELRHNNILLSYILTTLFAIVQIKCLSQGIPYFYFRPHPAVRYQPGEKTQIEQKDLLSAMTPTVFH